MPKGQPQRRGRGEGSVEQLPDGRWRGVLSLGVEYVDDPKHPGQKKLKRKRLKFYGKTKQEALTKLREAQAKSNAGQLRDDDGKTTFAAWAEHWQSEKKRAVAHSTWKRYKEVIDSYLVPRMGEVLLIKLTEKHVSDLYDWMAAQQYSNSEQRRAGQYLSTILRLAVKKGKIRVNPVADVPRPKKMKQEFSVWTAEQTSQVIKAAADHPLEAFFVLSLDSGARPGELYALHWPQVDLDARTISIIKALEEVDGELRLKEVKTEKGRRTLTISTLTVNALRCHRAKMRKAGFDTEMGIVFPNTDGGFLRYRNVYHRDFLPLVKLAGVPRIRPYDMRHTCATILLVAGVNIKIVSERLGHANIQITLEHYVKVLPGMQAIAAETFERLMTKPVIVPQLSPNEKGPDVPALS